MILGYDEKSELLLPPIHPGQSLPKEVLEFYEEHCSHLKGESRFTHSSAHVAAALQRSRFTVILCTSSAGLHDGADHRLCADTKTAADLSHSVSESGITVIRKGVSFDSYFTVVEDHSILSFTFCPLTSCLSTGQGSIMLGQLPLTPSTPANHEHEHEHRGGAIIVYGAPLTGTSSW